MVRFGLCGSGGNNSRSTYVEVVLWLSFATFLATAFLAAAFLAAAPVLLAAAPLPLGVGLELVFLVGLLILLATTTHVIRCMRVAVALLDSMVGMG